MALRITLLASILSLASLVLATPIMPELRSTTATHACTIFVQRWSDNSLDLYGYNYDWVNDNSGPANTMGAESTSLSAGGSISGTMGSYPVIVTDVRNPAVNGGVTNWNDPGELSFSWGSQSWSSSGASSPCNVIPVGTYGAGLGYPTNTTCHFSCDS